MKELIIGDTFKVLLVMPIGHLINSSETTNIKMLFHLFSTLIFSPYYKDDLLCQ